MHARIATVLIAICALVFVSTGQAFAYGYHYSYDVAEGIDAEEAFYFVRNNFDSVFPAASPLSTCGEELYVGLECDLVGADNKGHVRVEEVGSRHFVLRSLEGHAEGANKVINFTLANNYNDPSDKMLRLEVTASGKDNAWQQIPLTKRGNRATADQMWTQFATRIATLMGA